MEQNQSFPIGQENQAVFKPDFDQNSKSEQNNQYRHQVQLRNNKFANKTEQFFVTRNAVFRIFSDASNLESATATAVRALVQLFLSSSFFDFTQSFIDCFILIFEKIDTKSDKKVQNKFQGLISQLFKKLFIDRVSDEQEMIKSINFMKDLLLLCLQAAGSERSNVRVYGARISFILTSLIPGQAVSKVLAKDILRQYLISVQRLLLLQAPVYKQLGIKLASMVQPLFSENMKKSYLDERTTIQSRTRMQTIQKLLFRIVQAENIDNQNTRKLVITNVLVSKDNLSRMLKRLRDKSNQIKVIVIKKLVTQGYTIDSNYERFNLAQIYKIMYDGLNNKATKKDAVNFFSQYFKTWAEELLNKKTKKQAVQKKEVQKEKQNKKDSFLTMNMQAQQEQPEKQKQSRIFFQQNNQQYALGQSREQFLLFYNFVQLFQPRLLLLNPHLYEKFDELIKQLLIQLPSSVTSDYIKFLCQRFKFVAKNPDSISTIDLKEVSSQMIWLKNAMQTSNKQITVTFEKHRPYGKDLAMMLALMFLNQQIFGAYQLLQYFEKQTLNIPDQIGRKEMFKGLQHCLKQIKYFQPIYGQCEANQENDSERPFTIKDFKKNAKFGFTLNQPYSQSEKQLCSVPSYEELKKLKQMSTYYHSPLISSSYDLIYYIANAIKILSPVEYQLTMLEILSVWMKTKISLEDWQDIGEEVTLDKMTIPLQMQRKHLMQRVEIFQLGDLQNEVTQKKLAETKRQLKKVNFDIEKRQEKSKYLLLTLSRLNPQFSFQCYMNEQSIIGHYLKKYEQADGLILLGHHCLKRLDHTRAFLTMFWSHIEDIKPQSEFSQKRDSFKNMRSKDKDIKRMLVIISLRILTDLIVKFNILIGDLKIYKENDEIQEQHPQSIENQQKQKKNPPFDQENISKHGQKDSSGDSSQKEDNQQGQEEPKPRVQREELFNARMFMQKIFYLILDEDADIKNMAIQSLCRLLYHEKIPPKYFNTSLFYVLLLWCTCQHETVPKTQYSSPGKERMIYTLSMFVQCYTDPQTGKKQNLLKLAECFCVFFKIMSQKNQEGNEVCRKKIKYEFQMEQLMKHSIFTAVGMLRIKKVRQRNKAFATFGSGSNLKSFYQFQGPFKPQELFILYLLSEKGFEQIVDRATQITDFYSQAQCGLENLILVKEKVEEYLQHAPQKLSSKKGYGSVIQNMEKFEQTLKQKIKETGKQTFNERQIDSLRTNLDRFLNFIENQVFKIEEQMERNSVFSKKQIDLDKLALQFELRQKQNRRPTVRKNKQNNNKKVQPNLHYEQIDRALAQQGNNQQGLIIPNKSRSKNKTDRVVDKNKPWRSRAKNRQQLDALKQQQNQLSNIDGGQRRDQQISGQIQGQSLQNRRKKRRELNFKDQGPSLDELQKQRRAKNRSKGKNGEGKNNSRKNLAERQLQRANKANSQEKDTQNHQKEQGLQKKKKLRNQRSFLLKSKNKKFKRAYESDSSSPQMQEIEDPDKKEVPDNRQRSRNKKSKKQKWKSLFGHNSDTSQPQIPSSQSQKKSNEQSVSYYQTNNPNIEDGKEQEEQSIQNQQKKDQVEVKNQVQVQQKVEQCVPDSKSRKKKREKRAEQQYEEFLLPVPKSRLKRNNVQSSQDEKGSNEKVQQEQQHQSNNEKSNSQQKQQIDPQQKQRVRLANQKKFLSVKSRSNKIKPDRAISKQKADLLQYLTGGESRKPKNRKKKPITEEQESQNEKQAKQDKQEKSKPENGQQAEDNANQESQDKQKIKQKKPSNRRKPNVHRQILALKEFTQQNRYVSRQKQLDIEQLKKKGSQILQYSGQKQQKERNEESQKNSEEGEKRESQHNNNQNRQKLKSKDVQSRLKQVRKNKFLDQIDSGSYQPVAQPGINNAADLPRKYNIREPREKLKSSKENQEDSIPKLKCEKQMLQAKRKQNLMKLKSMDSKKVPVKDAQQNNQQQQNNKQSIQKGVDDQAEGSRYNQADNIQQIDQQKLQRKQYKIAKKCSKHPGLGNKKKPKDDRPSVVDFMTPEQIKQLERQKMKARLPKFLEQKSDESDFDPAQSRRKSKKYTQQQTKRVKRERNSKDPKQTKSKEKPKSLSGQKQQKNQKNSNILDKPSGNQKLKQWLELQQKQIQIKQPESQKLQRKEGYIKQIKQVALQKKQIMQGHGHNEQERQAIKDIRMPQKHSKKIKKDANKTNKKKDQDQQLSQQDDRSSKKTKKIARLQKKHLNTEKVGDQVQQSQNKQAEIKRNKPKQKNPQKEVQEEKRDISQEQSQSSEQKVGFSFVHHQANRKSVDQKESSDKSGQYNLRREANKKVKNYAKFGKQ